MANTKTTTSTKACQSLLLLLMNLTIPIPISVLFYNKSQGFDPVEISGYSFDESIRADYKNDRIVEVSEKIGDGVLLGPEDFAYDPENGFIYTGCADGWIKRVQVRDVVDEDDGELIVEDWVHVGGRPLGVALGSDGSVAAAEADRGLLLVKANKEVQLLTDEAEGLKFRLTDGVDVASNGIIYFTDASYKYSVHASGLDIFEGRPHGRLMSFDPSTNQTLVLVRDLYFPNGVALSPDQQSLVFCETPLMRCQRYHIGGDNKGKVEKFVDNLPGLPDNIRYDGEGHYWIGLFAGRTLFWDILMKYPFLRKISAVAEKFASFSILERDSGVMSVSLEGEPLAIYSDPNLHGVTVGLKVGKHLYYGSLIKPYISRINLTCTTC